MSYKPSNPNGQTTMANSEPVVIASNQSAIPVSGTFYQATQPVSLASVPTHGVTGTFWQATQPVSLASVPSHAVTNVGTFAVQAAQSGTWNIGSISTLPALAAGTNNIGDVDVLSVIPGTAATNLGKAVDSAAGATDTGILMLAVRDDALTTLNPIDSDYTQLRVTNQGRLWSSATIDAALPAGTNAIGSITNTSFAATQSGTWNIGSITTLPTLANVTTVGTVSAITAGPAIGSGFYVRNTDGTNTAAVKAASTAAIATDPALVVAISPNNTVPVSLASVPSHAVTNAGTFAVQVTSAPTTAVTGTFWQATQPVSGTVSANATLAANEGVVIGAVELSPATTNAPSNATTTAYAASLIVKASAGTLYSITGYNSRTSAQFIQIHDSATLPADTAVPKVIFMVPPGSNFSFDLTPFGRSFAAGITICNSSTGPTKTIGAADCWIDAQFK